MSAPIPTRPLFHAHLLPRTIQEALHVPFYARHWAGHDAAAVRTLADLPRLPVVTRDALQQATDTLRPDAPAVLLSHSSGTTGRPFVRYRGREELDAVASVVQRLSHLPAARPRVVFTTIARSTHGGGIPIPIQAHTIAISVNASWSIDTAVDLLRREPVVPGVEDLIELHGRPRHLAILAHALLRAATPAQRARVAFLTAVGSSLTRATRRYLAAAFPRAVMRETYSLSEVVAGAERCGACGAYHTDAPLIAELVALDSDGPSPAPAGRLVLTELHPFSILQPLIRYDTGDIARAVESGCDLGLAFDLLGRRQQTPIADWGDGPRVALSIWRLADALEEMPGAARSPLGNRLSAPYDLLPMGPPYAAARMESAPDPRLVIEVGVAFSPSMHPAAARAFEEELIARLLATDPDFQTARAHGVMCTIDLCEADRFPRAVNLGK